MSGPVLKPVETLTNRVTEEMKNAVLAHKIGHPEAPEVDWVILVYTRDDARWMVYRSNMGMQLLVHSLHGAIKLMTDHIKSKLKKQ